MVGPSTGAFKLAPVMRDPSREANLVVLFELKTEDEQVLWAIGLPTDDLSWTFSRTPISGRW